MKPSTLVFLLLVAACDRLPDKPDVDLCTNSIPDDVYICCSVVDEDRECDLVPAGETHGFYAMSPQDWKKYQLYLASLELIAKRGLDKYDLTLEDLLTAEDE